MRATIFASFSLLLLLLVAVPAVVYAAAIFEELNINTPLAHEIMRHAKAAGMKSFMNTSVAPCDDFYGYACGRFNLIDAATEETYNKDIFQTLNEGYQRRLRQLLKEPKMSNDSPTETRVKYFYESCLNTTTLRLTQRPHLLSILKEFGGLPALEGSAWNESMFDPIEMMARLMNRYGKATLLNVQVRPGLVNSQNNRLYLGQRDDLPSSKIIAFSQAVLKQKLGKLLGLSEKSAHETAAEINKINVELARGKIEPREELPPDQMNRMRLLDDMNDSYGPILNLTRFVQLWLKHDYQLPVYEYVNNYFWQVKKILTQTPKRVLANFMLSALITDYDLELSDNQDKQDEVCAKQTTKLFKDFVDHMVYRSLEKQNPDIPGNMRQLWQELKVAFSNILLSPSSSWLGEQTRDEALAKLKAMSFHILGSEAPEFENYYGGLVISTDDYFGNVQRILELRAQRLRESLQQTPSLNYYDEINLSPTYEADFNRVLIPTSFMQHRYFFDEVYPMALKYGTVGFSMAHEMAHGFDDLSRTFDGQGNLRDWWDRNATEQFEQRRQCLMDQFSGFTYNGERLTKMQIQAENIADNVAIRIAHAAYLSWLERSSLEAEKLPLMSHTPEQLFFLSLGQIWCSDLWAALRHWVAITDTHAPHKVRDYAIMANSDGFAQAYNCQQGDHMNPIHKCVIF
ncbi:neprilysin-1 [Drosophila grimshawi]|uniref:GH13190 n=1 Tax=Drosophila grimshawi TaxID=7222 RepID=B4JU03_DROGR|nr:neprilysin-1 [Drosophila grimshawi]EDV91582.1 GH13190 [Drosophila grimshawi]